MSFYDEHVFNFCTFHWQVWVMILATHSKMAEEMEEWSSRLRFSGVCQTEIETPSELNLSLNLDDLSDQPFEGIKQKRRMLEKRVSFPSDETQLVQNLEPTVPDVPGIEFI